MKFGSVPVDKAEGAILAHSEAVVGKRLRKGVALTASHIAALQQAGVSEVTVAQLEPRDVHEDQAALALAQALQDGAEGLRLSEPFTGRVNLIADGPGVVLLDVEKINAANAVNPMVTVATVGPFHQIHAGGMIATVKIISYAVPEGEIARAAELAKGAVGLAKPVKKTASLIITEIPGGPGHKGLAAIENRLSALEITLTETRSCPHDEGALADEIAAAKGDVVLILTGSATSDPQDVAPAALRRAGGTVDRFGMPVDPGNLLFLGDIESRPVIGLPGSARSPVLHGADWVLSRVACGIAVTSADIAGMGVGGLLKEIPTRPMPRRGRAR
ncbi:molybdopterin-binding protein [Roseovarius sp. EL26]|uniref:molybdopterin-binding protein n=1 Tax=Roseovarius sp. EL26 TaxID=2126672 RepID=UPI000EA34167|nr:molybdopterin-binding protein [Roseovarius sp. EL26]